MSTLVIPTKIKKYFVEAPASSELIKKTEMELGVQFPKQLREFYRLHNGYENEMLSFPYWGSGQPHQKYSR